MPSRPSNADALSARVDRLLRGESTTTRLSRIHLKTNRFDATLDFYATVLGLSVQEVSIEPKTGRPQAHLVHADGEETIRIEESDQQGEVTTNLGIAFSMPLRSWYLLRSRLQTRDYPFEEVQLGKSLCIKDPDGACIRVNARSDASIEAIGSHPPS